ncbi:MAG: response regulator [Alphaproteobacteria bacterium]|nr:response regulator [Alphaproteobacteria bacterium]
MPRDCKVALMATVLVVDDRVTNRAVLSRLAAAADADAEVHAFADPREAIAWAAEHTPDLVVTDFKMPHMDGAEFTRNFRKADRGDRRAGP